MNIMIDLETMGLSPNGVIVSIGAISFDNKIYKEFYERIHMGSSHRLGLDFYSSTVEWWLIQSEEARKELLGIGIDIQDGLKKLKSFIEFYDNPYVWSKGIGFDLMILKTAYELAKIQLPWDFRNERDVRTIYDFGTPEKLDKNLAHNALNDARLQAENIIRIRNEM